MKTTLKTLIPIIALCLVSLSNGCKDTAKNNGIVGQYESVEDVEGQTIEYHITHIKENIYGIKVEASFDGIETQTDYLEGSYNPNERILTTKRSNVILNYYFSEDFTNVRLLGEENDIALKRK